jgi:integrase
LRDAQHGLDPASVKQQSRDADTFEELARVYLERHAKPFKRSWKEDARIIDHELLPVWRARKAAEILRRDVIALLDRVIERGAEVAANRTKALISKIFNFGMLRGIVEHNPAYKVPNPGVEHSRDRVLSENEVRALWNALNEERPKIAGIFRLALLTAQRRGEIAGMRWDEVDLEGAWWTIPADRSKNGLPHRIPLGPQALAVLGELRDSAPQSDIHVFPGSKQGNPITNLQKPLRRLKRRSGIDFRIHDLRRTAASLMTGMGVSRLVVGKILNHAERGITAVYDRHSYDAEKRRALLKWGVWLNELVVGKAPGQVIQLGA